MAFRYCGILLLTLCVSASGISVNKCCPKGHYFNSELNCMEPDLNSEPVMNESEWILYGVKNTSKLTYNYGVRSCDLDHSKIDVTESMFFQTDGNTIAIEGGRNTTYNNNNFCIDNDADNNTYVILCPCLNHLCFKKCCGSNKYLGETDKCVYSGHMKDWSPTLIKGDNVSQLYEVITPPLECGSRGRYYLRGELLMKKGGYIYSDIDGSIAPDDYCGDFKSSRGSLETVVIGCLDKVVVEGWFYSFLSFLGAILLIITVVVHLILPDLSRMTMKMYVCHNISLALAHIVLGFLRLGGKFVTIAPACITFGYVMQFSFLAAFFWLNVMCLDMSWTFSGLRPPSGSQRERDRSKFIWYSVYAWGGSLAITGITLIVEHTVAYGTPFKPNVGTIKCWFKDAEALWIFFYGPMAILLLMNLALFVYTSYRIVVLRRGTATLHQGDSARHGGSNPTNRDKQRYILYAKLFSLMGVTWLTEIISWAVGGPDYIWYVTDAINLLRAVFIFIIFCWKPRVWKVIKKRISCVKKCEEVICAVCCGKKSIDCPEDPKTSSTNSQRQTCSIKMDPIGTRLP